MDAATTELSSAAARVLVVGGSGRLGQLLRRVWARRGRQGFVFQSRGGAGGCAFEPLGDPAGYARAATGVDAIFCLAGVTAGEPDRLALNTGLALAAVEAARDAAVPQVFLASSAAVYGRAENGTCEDDAPQPVSDYGRAKRAMEEAVLDRAACGAGWPRVTCLRIGNVAGADQLLGAPETGGVQVLDICADGQGPRRSYIGPQALAAMLDALFAQARAGAALPPILNAALEGAVAMEALLEADGRLWRPQPAAPAVIPELCLDTTLLSQVIGPLGRTDAGAIVADFRGVAPRSPAVTCLGGPR